MSTQVTHFLYRGRHPCVAQTPQQIDVRVDEIIRVAIPWVYSGTPTNPVGWLEGTSSEGKKGLFPSSHVMYWGEERVPRSPSPPLPSSSTGNGSRTMPFSDYAKKAKARRTEKQKKTITVTHLNSSGKTAGSFPVEVPQTADVEDIVKAAVVKHSTFDALFDKEPKYQLLYKDRTVVQTIPGTEVHFSLGGYKAASGLSWSKIIFYLRKCDVCEGDTLDAEDDLPDIRVGAPVLPLDASTPTTATATSLSRNAEVGAPVLPLDASTPTTATATSLSRNAEVGAPVLPLDASTPTTATATSLSRNAEVGAPVLPLDASTPTTATDTSLSRNAEAFFVSAGTPTVSVRHTALNLPFSTLLCELNSQLELESVGNIVNVDRTHVLEGLFRALPRSMFNPKKKLFVRFSGELGIDGSGPSRELFRLALQELQCHPMFCGETKRRLLHFDYTYLEEKEYYLAGLFLAYVIVHNGPLPKFLHPALYEALATGQIYDCSVEDVPEEEFREKIKAIGQASHPHDYDDDIIELAGCTGLALKLENKATLMKSLIHFFTIARHTLAINQFEKGLRTLGVLDAIRRHPATMREAFLHSDVPQTATTVEDLFEVVWSPEGTNQRRQEEVTHTYFRDFLLDLEEADELDKFLIFTTGADRPPPMGFQPKCTITFGHPEVTDYTTPYPKANTCTNTIRLPVLPSYAAFKTNVMAVIRNVTFFCDH